MLVVPLLMFCLLMRTSLGNVKNQGFVEDTIDKHRYECPHSQKLTYTVASQIQCVGRCSMEKQCRILNFVKREDAPKSNCEVIFWF